MIAWTAALAAVDLMLLVLPDARVALAVHLLLTLVAGALWWRAGRLASAPAVLGILGPAGLLAGIVLSRLSRYGGADLLPELPSPHRRSPHSVAARLLDGRVRHAAPEALGSLVAVMRQGDVPTRRRALETVVRSFEPALSPLVALALTDADQTIRALAAAAAARIAANFAAARAALEERIAAGEPDAAPRLAALLAEHARANVLLSDQHRAALRQEALRLDSDPRVRAEAAWAAGDYAALDALAAAHAPGDPGDPVAPLRGWWRAEPA